MADLGGNFHYWTFEMRFKSMGSRRRLQHCCRLLRLQYVVLIYSFFARRRLCTWPKTDSSLLTCTDVGGKREGTDTLEVAKQFWKMVSCAISVPVESFRELTLLHSRRSLAAILDLTTTTTTTLPLPHQKSPTSS